MKSTFLMSVAMAKNIDGVRRQIYKLWSAGGPV